MARPSADYHTTHKTARLRLDPRTKPYYRGVGQGKSLGYIRRASGPGTWVVREWIAGKYATRVIGSADDLGHADGRDVLTYEQALRIATQPELPASRGSSITVREALDRYLGALEKRSDHAREVRQRAEKHILPKLGHHRVDRLTKTQIETWLGGMVADTAAPDARRRSQDSANRILTILKAALNAAFGDDANGIKSDAPWRRLKKFRGVAGTREDHFDADAIRQLIAAAAAFDPAFADLVQAGYVTGCRLGELSALSVRDFDAGRASLTIRKAKTGPRIVTLTSESIDFFAALTKGRPDSAVLLPRADGERWRKSEQARPFKRAAAAVGLPATASFYCLRHSHVSRAIEVGMPLSLVAENCGTSMQMLQQSYAKVLASTRRDFVERTSPKLRIVK